jgi:excisionase family DNA binding protein
MARPSGITPAAEFTNAEAAAYLGISPEALEIWRCTGRYQIPYLKIGRRVRYRRAHLDAWLASRTVGACGAPQASGLDSVA